ncbi:MAG: DUF6056 family protein [Paludibacteraceae bacterium]
MFSFLSDTNPGLSECFFWQPGIVIWILSIVLFNVFLYLIIYEIKSNSPNSFRFVAIALLAFIMTSENEIVFIFMGIFGLILLYDLFKLKSQNRSKVIILLLVLIVGAGIVLLGPGNYVRLKFISTEQQISYLQVIKSDFLLYRKIFFLSGAVILNIILIPFYYSITKNTVKFIQPSKLLAFSFFVLIILLLPSFVAKLLYSFRIQNVVYYFSLLLIFVNFTNLSIWLREKQKIRLDNLSKILIIFAGYFFLSYFMQKESTLRTAYSDILTEKARKFDVEMNDRYLEIRNSKEDNLILQPLKNKPKSIYIEDITTDSGDWRNGVYSKYFGKKTIVLSE